MTDLVLLKKLREETGAGVMDCQRALEQFGGDVAQAREHLKALGVEKAAKKADREVKAGLVDAYLHATGRVGAVVSLACETDFVARTDDFKKLAREIAMQAAAMKPQSVEELLDQVYIRDTSKKVRDLLIEISAKVGENIVVKDFRVLEI
ncbi:MAG: translation elongation factor Ts [Patescibacteria group bacterium]|nr:translation elongation factor Ts [Patescibacteria group bacterium]